LAEQMQQLRNGITSPGTELETPRQK
jgi:hypothetical protein